MIILQGFTKKRLQQAQTNETINMYSLNPETKEFTEQSLKTKITQGCKTKPSKA